MTIKEFKQKADEFYQQISDGDRIFFVLFSEHDDKYWITTTVDKLEALIIIEDIVKMFNINPDILHEMLQGTTVVQDANKVVESFKNAR